MRVLVERYHAHHSKIKEKAVKECLILAWKCRESTIL
nr:MAG TPA: hypothetical protein [Caudoviricetes sp.]